LRNLDSPRNTGRCSSAGETVRSRTEPDRLQTILTARSDSNDGPHRPAPSHPRVQSPARHGRCQTVGHRFWERRVQYCSEVPQPWKPNEDRPNATRPLTTARDSTEPCCPQFTPKSSSGCHRYLDFPVPPLASSICQLRAIQGAAGSGATGGWYECDRRQWNNALL
jgi:hypothetical protein